MNLYDLLARGLTLADLPRLAGPREARALLASPEFFARPGQTYEPGLAEIDLNEGGRGSGKSFKGTLAVLRAAREPERWGGFALMAGPDPQAVESDMLMGASGLLTIGRQVAEAGLGPAFTYNPSKLRVTFEAPRGGGSGLTVLLRASSKPHGGRGPNVGLAWLDEFGVWYHRKTDEQGTNLWRALRPAIRAGRPTSHIIVTMTPSRQPEVRALQRDAERPECPRCMRRYLEEHGAYDGDVGLEPWRLPRSPQVRLHPLLDSRTTVVERECPACTDVVVAAVQTTFFATTDNPHIDEGSRARARRALASGQSADRMEFAPTGEADTSPRGALVLDEHVRRVEVGVTLQAPDPWAAALATLGIAASDVLVFVDPAVTSKATSDESGVGVAGVRWTRDEGPATAEVPPYRQCVGLQDWSVRPGEVTEGAPSGVWAPRAVWLALLWGAPRVAVETNQGGDEVLATLRSEVERARRLTERELAERLAREYSKSEAAWGMCARRIAQTAHNLQVAPPAHRRADKFVRWEWYGTAAGRGEQALACVAWTGGARAWSPVVAQLTGLERPVAGSGGAGGGGGSAHGDQRRDRADWLVGASQVLLGVRETAQGHVVQQGNSWLSGVSPGLLG